MLSTISIKIEKIYRLDVIQKFIVLTNHCLFSDIDTEFDIYEFFERLNFNLTSFAVLTVHGDRGLYKQMLSSFPRPGGYDAISFIRELVVFAVKLAEVNRYFFSNGKIQKRFMRNNFRQISLRLFKNDLSYEGFCWLHSGNQFSCQKA